MKGAGMLPVGLTLAQLLDFPNTQQAKASLLTAQQPVSDARELLRDSLPITNKPIRRIQKEIFTKITEAVRVPNVKMSEVQSAVSESQKVLAKDKPAIIKDVVGDAAKKDASATLAQIELKLNEFQEIIDKKDKQEIPIKQQEILSLVERIENDMIPSFPFKVPAEYASGPLLMGRAAVEMQVTCKSSSVTKGGKMKIVLDGYNAPVTAGNFLDLVKRKFYDGMPVQRADGFVVQSGDPGNKQTGFIDPNTKELRTVPLEIMVKGDKTPIYDATLDDVGRYKEVPNLPFNAFGTLAMARAEFEPNSASSQFFFLLKESELTPSGTNVLDGRYGVFGYITEGKELLKEVKQGDTIDYIKVISGSDNCKNCINENAVAAASEDVTVA
eukprot:CAMPEP_0167790970 /NCGR_PEP_ID=MMETSP0111_2-20121227/11637_1 /TAXON_ID=91324 /ORGANISM="Lotharella globosa, Strain CCCM811" /LENGTH=384 /DNA_ID=CAMNT_0007683509 /DNA_START=259 /DNA_END=1413 /DNA_ORIENTATION=+